MKWSEFERILLEKGWNFTKRGKKHDIYLHVDHDEPIFIERHKSQEIKKGLYKSLKKKVGF